MVPDDPILGLTEQFVADPRPHKINLGVGVYVDEAGRVPLLECVRSCEQALARDPAPRGYLPIDGLPAYIRVTQTLLFGADSPLLADGRVATAQTIGGSGALRVGADLLRRVFGPGVRIAISDPSWGNHHMVFRAAGFELLEYRYYHAASKGLDAAGMLEDLGRLPQDTVVLLHACCHNPTGVDLDDAQWHQVAAVMKERRLLPFVDFAYQGFDRGTAQDAAVVRLLGEAGFPAFVVANSYSKSFSLYGERVGGLSLVGADRDEAARLRALMKAIIRANYSSPATHGGRLVAGVLESAELRARWESELAGMRGRIRCMRAALVDKLAARGATQFGFFNRQTGMFSYSGLDTAQVDRLREEFAIYALASGRICVAALNDGNIDAVAEAVATISR
jgi:aromatic-amino-acid transaminase